MRVLITGGNGFAGRFLTNYFSENGYEVIATYRSTKPKEPWQSNIKYIKCELSETISIDGDFDAIIHTAVSHSGEILPMKEYVRDNIDSARQIIEFAHANGIKTIIYFSTRSIYGDVRQFSVDENTDIINPGRYGVTKYIAEQLFQDTKDIDTLGIRLPGVIGPGAHDIWLADIVSRIKSEQDVEISDFDTVNLVDINDISRFIEKMIMLASKGMGFKYPVVNLACNQSINNLEIARMIKDRFDSKSEIKIKQPVLASFNTNGGLFELNSDKAIEMGFEPSAPADIVNRYLDYVISHDGF